MLGYTHLYSRALYSRVDSAATYMPPLPYVTGCIRLVQACLASPQRSGSPNQLWNQDISRMKAASLRRRDLRTRLRYRS